MYVCMCNPFTDKDLNRVLNDSSIPKTPAQVYKAASNGETPQCGTCLCMIREMVSGCCQEQ